MAPQEDYKSIWLSKISDFVDRARNSDGYHRLLRKEAEFLVEIETALKRSIARYGIDDSEREKIMALLAEDRGYMDVRSAYGSLVRKHKELLNIEVQVRKSDIESKARFLIFRILTAIGIALVVLGTGIIAHKLQIPLPLLRVGA